MKKLSALASILGVVVLFVAIAGCKPSDGLQPVEGTVTLDGQPLESGSINIGPMVGQPGTAVGGKIVNGMYQVRASKGEMAVTIRAQKSVPIENPTEDEIAHNVTERVVELIPERYNQRSELKITVNEGKNTFNFDLESDSKE